MQALIVVLAALVLASCSSAPPPRQDIARLPGLVIVVSNPFDCLGERPKMKCAERSLLQHQCRCVS